MKFQLWLEQNIAKVYRGTGPIGMNHLRPSEEGVYGPGIYFYDNLKDATAFAEPNGGVVVAEVDLDDPEIQVIEKPVYMVGTNIELRKSKIIIVPTADKIQILQQIPISELS